MLSWTFIVIVVLEITSSSVRKKRVLNGQLVSKDSPGSNYDVVKYYATYSTIHGWPWWSFHFIWLNRWSGKGWYGQIFCGGALLTPKVVQTACHCLSYWSKSYYTGMVARPWIDHHWETVRVVYVGVTTRFYDAPSMFSVDPIKTVKFMCEPHAGKLRTKHEPNTYDYGYILIDSSWQQPGSGVPTDRVGFAPTYTLKEMQDILNEVRLKQSICLHIGFGWYRLNTPITASRMLHGWGVAIGEEKCLNKTAPDLPKQYVTELVNWFCTETYENHIQPTQHGDSGSPITCNNNYVGVNSGHRYEDYRDENNRLTTVYWSLHGATAAVPLAMAAENRQAFMERLENIAFWSFLEFLVHVIPRNYTFSPRILHRKLFSLSTNWDQITGRHSTGSLPFSRLKIVSYILMVTLPLILVG